MVLFVQRLYYGGRTKLYMREHRTIIRTDVEGSYLFDGRCGIETGFPPSTSLSPASFHHCTIFTLHEPQRSIALLHHLTSFNKTLPSCSPSMCSHFMCLPSSINVKVSLNQAVSQNASVPTQFPCQIHALFEDLLIYKKPAIFHYKTVNTHTKL
jgi:hypothetical protein